MVGGQFVWKLLTAVWLLVPPAFAAWHFGPGQKYMRSEEAAASLRAARQAGAAGDWDAAVAAYADALGRLPEDRVAERRRLRLAQAAAKLRGKTFAQGREELLTLVGELENEPGGDPDALDAARSALAYSQFHAAWLMRLEGRPRLDWEPEVEAARQRFRVSTELAVTRGDTAAAARFREDLESTVRMARADLADLQAMNLPDELRESRSDGGEGNRPGKGKGKGKGEGEGEGDRNDSRGASSGPPPDTGGH
jgi:hypothetical protein